MTALCANPPPSFSIYIFWNNFCSGQKQIPNVLKITTDSWGAVVLIPKARTHKSLIRNKNADHKVGSLCWTHEVSPNCLTHQRTILRVSICWVSMLVYNHKVSRLKTSLLRNGEVHNGWTPQWSWSFFNWWCLHCDFNISTTERF